MEAVYRVTSLSRKKCTGNISTDWLFVVFVDIEKANSLQTFLSQIMKKKRRLIYMGDARKGVIFQKYCILEEM